jgi:hypothetical protein
LLPGPKKRRRQCSRGCVPAQLPQCNPLETTCRTIVALTSLSPVFGIVSVLL